MCVYEQVVYSIFPAQFDIVLKYGLAPVSDHRLRDVVDDPPQSLALPGGKDDSFHFEKRIKERADSETVRLWDGENIFRSNLIMISALNKIYFLLADDVHYSMFQC